MADTKAKTAKDNYQKVYVMNEQNDAGKYIPTVAKGVTTVDGAVDIRNMPAVSVSRPSPFTVGTIFRIQTFNFGTVNPTREIMVDEVRDNWIRIRNINGAGQPYGTSYWLNAVWIFTTERVRAAASSRTKKPARKKT